ncbi:PTS-dependent dihydroxyacetone kinase 1, dihydroxyacetone-binding subunit DhaK [Nilaparvata lugens]|uniref:PTS-dependent dihydroxyacetone kinase 1, dihydroxyacetone-binding subunit DhaK n=1 Tax=Nilaparvata lugens TaxID=108931 RepID=UPI00193E5112|nr:PTS-dependent dihydroxyacetone kinase 1, dihydroxyacetone-binding subunit DhaK [Nilaparvata lugens]
MSEVRRHSTSSSAHSSGGSEKDKDKQKPYVNKLLIYSTSKSVEDMVHGISKTYPSLITDKRARVVMIPHEEVSNAVGLISGGGAGHEPFPSGLVGTGMLTASVSGHVFTTPSSSYGLAAIYNVNLFKKGGVLVLVLNYSGTILHFTQACEFARDMSIRADTLVVGEDCSHQKAGNKKVLIGKRGLVGIVFLIKIAGAMSVRGAKMAVIKGALSDAVNMMASIAIGNKCCIVPGQHEPHFSVRPNHIQIGVGVHGQSGNETLEFSSSSETVRIIMKKISSVLKLSPGNSVCAIVSSLGGSTLLECYTIAADLSYELEKMDIHLERMYVATLFSALDMGGLQVCIMKVTEENKDWINCLDDHTDAPAWPGRCISYEKSKYIFREAKFNKIQYKHGSRTYDEKQSAIFRGCIERVAHAVMDVHDVIEKLGRMDGYGNCGLDFKIFAEVILQELNDLPFGWPNPCMLKLSNLASEEMGGMSGGLYSLMLKAAAQEAPDWPRCLQAAVNAVTHYTAAERGDGTMVTSIILLQSQFIDPQYSRVNR